MVRSFNFQLMDSVSVTLGLT